VKFLSFSTREKTTLAFLAKVIRLILS
jgi:hypothetical protein